MSPADGPARLGRRDVLRRWGAGAVALAGGTALAGCGPRATTAVATYAPAGTTGAPKYGQPSGTSAATGASTASSLPPAVRLSGTLASPALTGEGVPSTSAAALVTGGRSLLTVTGDGGEMQADSDNCVLACTAATVSDFTLTCRLRAWSNLNCPYLYPWARAGIMARANLSSCAPLFAVAITAGYGAEVLYRASSDSVLGHATNGAPLTSLTPADVNGVPTTTARDTANVLAAPVWLRLQRSGTNWTGAVSSDGVHWVDIPAVATGGNPSISMAACWVGAFACASNLVFAEEGELAGALKGQVRATFDQLAFSPSTAVQIGQAQGLAPGPQRVS